MSEKDRIRETEGEKKGRNKYRKGDRVTQKDTGLARIRNVTVRIYHYFCTC